MINVKSEAKRTIDEEAECDVVLIISRCLLHQITKTKELFAFIRQKTWNSFRIYLFQWVSGKGLIMSKRDRYFPREKVANNNCNKMVNNRK